MYVLSRTITAPKTGKAQTVYVETFVEGGILGYVRLCASIDKAQKFETKAAAAKEIRTRALRGYKTVAAA